MDSSYNFSSNRHYSRQPYSTRPYQNEYAPYVSRHSHANNRPYRRPDSDSRPRHSESRRSEKDLYILSVNESNVKKAAENLLLDRSYVLGMIDKRSPAAYAMESLFNVVEVYRRMCNRLTDENNDLQAIIDKNTKSAEKIKKPVQPKMPSNHNQKESSDCAVNRLYPGLTPIQVRPKPEPASESEKEGTLLAKSVVNQQPSFTIPKPQAPIARPLLLRNDNASNQAASSDDPIISSVKLPRISPAIGMLAFVDESTYYNEADSNWSSKAKRRIAHQSDKERDTIEPKTKNSNVVQQSKNNLSPPDSPLRNWSEQDVIFFRDIIRRLNATKDQKSRQNIINELREKNLFTDFLQFKSRYHQDT